MKLRRFKSPFQFLPGHDVLQPDFDAGIKKTADVKVSA
jgi:hypothetical protein